MAARKESSTGNTSASTSGRRAGKSTAQKQAITEANAKGETVHVLGPDGVTERAPGKTPRKVATTQKADGTPAPKGSAARKTAPKAASKTPAKGKAAPKGKKPAGEATAAPQPEEKRPVGRPTVFRPEFCQMLITYFRIPVESVEHVTTVDSKGKEVTEAVKVLNTFPTLTRFADQLEVTRQTLHDWATALNTDGSLKHPEFSYAYARARDLQESLIIEGGMAGAYDPRFASLASKNLIGWKDQVESQVVNTHAPATVEKLDAIYEAGIANAATAKAAVLARQAAAEQAEADERAARGG